MNNSFAFGKRLSERKRQLTFVVLSVVSPLFIGAVLYYFLCPDVLFVRKIDDLLNISERNGLLLSHWESTAFIRNYFFDYLWAFAFANALFLFFDNKVRTIFVCASIPVMVGAVMEYLQFVSLAKGTFDIWDIAVEYIGSLCGVLITSFCRRKEK